MSSNNSINRQDLSQLFQGATSTDPNDNGLSRASVGLLIQNLNPQVVQGAQFSLDLDSTSQTIVMIVNDKSSSMLRFQDDFIFAYNEMLAAWRDEAKGGDEFILSQWQFADTSHCVHSFLPIKQVANLDNNTYDPSGSTALYDTVMDALKATIGYVLQLQNAGNTVRVVFVIMTDGEDNVSRKTSAADIKVIVDDLIRQEVYHVALWGFGADGVKIGLEMGIPAGNILVTGTDRHGIRQGTGQISRSTIRVSQGQVGVGTSQNFFTT